MKREQLIYVRWAFGIVGLVLLVVSFVARSADHHENLAQDLLTAGIVCMVAMLVTRYVERLKV